MNSRHAARIRWAVIRYLLLAAGTVIFTLPMMYMISTSLRPNGALYEYPPRFFPRWEALTLENYDYILHQSKFYLNFLNSVTVSVTTIALAALVGSAMAFVLGKFQSKLTRVLFRDPSLGWHEHKEALFFGDEKRVSGEFTELFYRHLMLRPSCTVCPYASVQRVSDLTMADCWGVEKALPGFADDNRGCSLLLCNTPEGKAFAAEFPAERVERRPVALEKVMQANFLAPSTPKDGADLFENTYLRRGYSVALRRCRPGAIGIRLRRWARKAGIKL